MTQRFDEMRLHSLYDAVSTPEGVRLSELRDVLSAFETLDIAEHDLQAYREGRKPWKKLRDEIVPTERFLSAKYPDDARVRFALNDKAPDAWVTTGGDSWSGIEVTGALARAGVEVARTLRVGKPVPGFIPLQDGAPQKSFDEAKTRARFVNSRVAVDEAIDRSIEARLAGKDDPKFAGHTLLIVAPIGSSPGRSVEDLQRVHRGHAQGLPFEKVFVLDRGERSAIVELK